MKRLSYFILLALLMSLTSTPVLGQTKFQEGGIWYTTEYMPDGEVKVTHYGNSAYSVPAEYKYSGDVVIPATVTHGEPEREYTVTSFAPYAFWQNTSLTSITIPNSVTTIGDQAFNGCSGLESITIPNSVTNIGDQAFNWCSGLKSITVASGNPIYDSRNNCNAIIEKSTNKLIMGCKNTVIPNDVTVIGRTSFYGTTSLTSITIPSSVTSIDALAFVGCSGLTSVYFLRDTPPTIGDNSNLTNQATVYVPLQYLDSYRSSASGPITDAKLYPLLLPGTAYRTFSFDKAVDLSSIAGLNNPGNTLTAYIVSAVDTEGKTVTLSKVTGEVAANAGIIIKGTGAEGEYYPIRPATGETLSLTNYMIGSGATEPSIAAPVDGKQRYFIMDGSGDFYYCTGEGTLPKYKAYLDIETPIAVGGGSSAKGFSIVFEDEESTGISGIAETTGAQADVWYTLGGQRLQGKPSTKGLYIVNGKKVIVK